MIKKKNQKKPQRGASDNAYLCALRILFALSFVLVGLYYELCSAIISVCLLLLLLWRAGSRGLSIRLNLAFFAAASASLFYIISCFWGVDPALSLWGGVKYLPVLLFPLAIMQTDADGRSALILDIPKIGAAMTAITFVLQFIPALSSSFSVSGRLAGFFQYPNTFACFLLLGLIVIVTDEFEGAKRWTNTICGVVLIFGVLQAGSRAVFVIAVPALIAAILIKRQKSAVFLSLGALAGGILLNFAASYAADVGGSERILEISGEASTFLGRILYWKDSLSVIASHPFGMGYLGYYITEGSFQTGVYSVRWVHNDFLQLLLDVGWIPAALAAIAIVKSLFSKRLSARRRVLLLTLLAHCMTDFDLEFVAMYFVLFLCLDFEEGKERLFRTDPLAVRIPTAAAVLASLYIGTASTLTYAGLDAAASAFYPWNTLSNIELLTEAETTDEMSALAEKILSQNDKVSLAWDAKAQVAYSNGDFGTVITAKREAISLARYSIDEYVDYFEKLAIGVTLYREAGDAESAEICLSEIKSIQTMLDELAEKTDPIAWRLADTPLLEMPQEYEDYLESEGLTE